MAAGGGRAGVAWRGRPRGGLLAGEFAGDGRVAEHLICGVLAFSESPPAGPQRRIAARLFLHHLAVGPDAQAHGACGDFARDIGRRGIDIRQRGGGVHCESATFMNYAHAISRLRKCIAQSQD